MIIKNNGNFNNNGVIGNNNNFTNYGSINAKEKEEMDHIIDEIITKLKDEPMSKELKNLIEENVKELKNENSPSNLEKIFKILEAFGSTLKWLPENLNSLKTIFGL